MFRTLLVVFAILVLVGCDRQSRIEKEIEKIAVDIEVIRFDRAFARTNPQELEALQRKYPFLFPQRYEQQVWVDKLSDTIEQEIHREVGKAFPDFSTHTDELYRFFQHIKYYFPDFRVPDIYTVTSEVDYKNKVVASPDKLFIALDNYLGKDHHFYIGLQEYLKKNFEPSQILPDVATAYAKKFIERPRSRTFLAQMLYYGKILYLKDLWIPFKTDAEKIGYSSEELAWARGNEDQIWRYFVEKEYLFDTDSELYTRFLYPAPFSKFYLQLDNEAPDRLGQYIGWQIIRAYARKEGGDLEDLLKADSETIFRNAKYKPKK